MSFSIVSPVIGAVIGYFTNWLAIKMLFRPHNEMRIGRFRVPFTPGLIPKERYTLAKKVASTVGTHLLTTDVLMNELTSSGTLQKIDDIACDLLNKIQNDQTTVEDGLKFFLGENNDHLMEQTKSGSIEFISVFLSRPDLIESVSCFISDRAVELLKNPSVIKNTDEPLSLLRPYIINKVDQLYNDEHFDFIDKNVEVFFEKYLYEGRTIASYLPEKVTTSLKSWIQDNIPGTAGIFKNFMENNPVIDEKLRNLTKKIIEDNFGKLVGIFFNSEKIYENIKEGLYEYLSDANNQEDLTDKAWKALDGFLEKDISVISEKFDKQAISRKLSDAVKDWFTTDFVNTAFDYLGQQVDKAGNFNIYDIVIKIEPDFDAKLKTFINDKITAYESEVKSIVGSIVEHLFTIILSLELNKIIEAAGGEKNIRKGVNDSVDFLLKKGAVHIIGSMNIEQMVEDKINQFEVNEAEDIIMSVVNKELQAITVVGGVLGFVIGLLPQLLQFLY